MPTNLGQVWVLPESLALAARRGADGLQLVVERGDGSTHNVKVSRKAVDLTAAQLLREDGVGAEPHGLGDAVFLKLGRRAARLSR